MWDECYAEPGYAYGTAPNDFLAAVVDRIPDGRVLCLAEGEGRNATFLAQWERQVTAVDASAVGMAKAAALAAERGVKLDTVVADLATYELQPGAWDAIVLIFAHLPPPRCASGSTAPPAVSSATETSAPSALSDVRTVKSSTRAPARSSRYTSRKIPDMRNLS